MTFRIDRFSMNEAVAMAGGDARLGRQIKGRLDKAFTRIEEQINDILAAQAAATAANAAAVAANSAAATANSAASAAQSTADSISSADQLAKSYVSGTPPILTASDAGSDATITIAAHTRNYPQPDGTVTSVSVAGGTLTGRSYSTVYYVYYDQASRAGGTVSYQTTTSDATAAQIGDRHCVGAVETPAAAAPPNDGAYTRAPGPGSVGQLP